MSDDLKNEIIEGGAELLEVGLDQLFDSEVLKDIPILGTAVRVASVARTIRDRLFAAKVRQFLLALPSIQETDRERFRSKLNSDAKFREKLGETLLLTLDSMNAMDKAAILAKLFSRLINDDITFAYFHRLSAALNTAYIGDLLQLIDEHNEIYGYNKDYVQSLVGTGLAEYVPVRNTSTPIFEEVNTPIVRLKAEVTNLGRLFRSVMRDK